MKTALQKAMKDIAYLWSSPSDTPTYSQIFEILESKLKDEKEQIIQAYLVAGINNYDNKKFPNITPEYFEISGEQYYNKHFTNESN